MSRTRYIALLASLSLLAACGGEDPTTDPDGDPPTGDPIASSSDQRLWEMDGVQYLGWDSENARVLTKENDDLDFSGGSDRLTVTLQSIGLDGQIGWEHSPRLNASQVLFDFTPWPALPHQETPPRIGHHLVTSGGHPGPTNAPTGSEYIEFPGSLMDMRTGEFVSYAEVGVTGEGIMYPYGDFGIQWERIPDKDRYTLTMYDSDFDKLVDAVDTKVTEQMVIPMEEAVLLGGDFEYEAVEEDQRVKSPEDFTITFLDLEDYSLTDVTLPGDLAPQPLHGESMGQFTNELQVVPLSDGILWNTGGQTWTIIDMDGVVDTIEMPENTTIVKNEYGGGLATIDDFLSAFDDFTPATHDQRSGYLSNGETPMTVTLDDTTVTWSIPGGEKGQTQTVSIDPSIHASEIRIGPNNAWIGHPLGVVSVSGDEIVTHSDIQFLEHIDGMDVFSTTGNGFARSADEMGEVFAIPND